MTRERHALNAPGEWYVDSDCIDCSAARTVAPGLIVAGGGQSVFARQPKTEEELIMAWRARLLCPTASVRTASHASPPENVFPEWMTEGIYRLGYNARSSWGAHSFLIRRPTGNVIVDAPRWTKAVSEMLEAWGGLSGVLLTHRDDVADAGRYAAHFGAPVWIHDADHAAAPFASEIVSGRDPHRIDERWLAVPVPGHTEGSMVYLCDERYLFTGDSFAWNFERSDLVAFRDACWFSWSEQARSLRRLLDYRFEWVFAGHGGSRHLPPEEMHARLTALVHRMDQPA